MTGGVWEHEYCYEWKRGRLLNEIVIDVKGQAKSVKGQAKNVKGQAKRNKSSSIWRRIQEIPYMKDWAPIWKSASPNMEDCKSALTKYNERVLK